MQECVRDQPEPTPTALPLGYPFIRSLPCPFTPPSWRAVFGILPAFRVAEAVPKEIVIIAK